MNVESLKGKFFLDTNIFVYSFDRQALQKQQTARQLIETAQAIARKRRPKAATIRAA